jgi:hypothetical protein
LAGAALAVEERDTHEHLRHATEDLVAGGMAELVVDLLEAIEIDDEDSPTAALAAGAGQLMLERLALGDVTRHACRRERG